MKIKVGSPPLSFYAIQGALVCAVLERAGHETEHVMEFHEEIYPLLGSGEIDVFCATWLPSAHASLWAPVKHQAIQLGCLFRGGGFHIAVSPVLAAQGVRRIRDLARFAETDRQIVSVGPGGATLTARACNAVEAYGLCDVGFEVHAVPEVDWKDRIEYGISQNQIFAAAIWRPSFVNACTDLVILEDEESAMGPKDDGWLTVNREFLRTAPDAIRRLLRDFHLDLETIETLDSKVVMQKRSASDVAREWLASNREKVDQMIFFSLLYDSHRQ